jgi:hypothetical protein
VELLLVSVVHCFDNGLSVDLGLMIGVAQDSQATGAGHCEGGEWMKSESNNTGRRRDQVYLYPAMHHE